MKRRYKESLGSKIFDVFNIIFMILLVIVMLYPFLNQLAISLNDSTDAIRGGIYLWPRKFSLRSYEYVFMNKKLLKAAFISILRVIVGTSTSVIATALLAYIIQYKDFQVENLLEDSLL